MSNVKEVKVKKVKVTLDKERHLKYDLNAFAELEEHFGSVEKAMDAMKDGSVKALRVLLWAGLVHEDESITVKQVGSWIDFNTLLNITDKVNEAIADSLPASEEVEGGVEGNLEAKAKIQ